MADTNNGPSNVAYTLEDIKYPFTIQGLDWANYDTYRPKYPPSMWETWLKHHKFHGGLMDAVHDIGAGLAAKELSTFFSHVFVSDPGENNIAAARQLLTPAAKFTFCQKPAEVPWLEDSSVDFSSICMAAHWMNSETSLRNVARSLRPGGTLAMCAYSFMLNFPDSQRLEKLWSDAVKTAIGGFIDNGDIGLDEMRGMRKFMVGLDGTAIPDHLFTHVLRLQINIRSDKIKPFCFVPDGQFELHASQIKASEKVQHMDDRGWRTETDVDWLKGYLASSNMPFGDKTWNTPSWREFERIISEDFMGKIVVEWPVAMILATRKG
ncbi:Methyltransferase gedG-like protein [Cladobotryum mycophilum]|uniref:Methyltransferase gedG-like protein n=1 Tax=Cladobotryum mycophilum TaxID=491253 RepID=A0ABR0S6R3_9HYPO